MEHNYCATCGNVWLRPLMEEDIEKLRQWRNDKRNSEYLSPHEHITKEKQEEWYRAYQENDDEITFAICIKENEDQIVGSLSLYNFKEDSAEFGKFLIGEKSAHGKSVGHNAVLAALYVAFISIGLKKISLFVFSNNTSALTCYKHAGFITDNEYIKETSVSSEFLMTISDDQYRKENQNA